MFSQGGLISYSEPKLSAQVERVLDRAHVEPVQRSVEAPGTRGDRFVQERTEESTNSDCPYLLFVAFLLEEQEL